MRIFFSNAVTSLFHLVLPRVWSSKYIIHGVYFLNLPAFPYVLRRVVFNWRCTVQGWFKRQWCKKISPQLKSLNKFLQWWSLIIVFTHYFNFFAVWMNTFNCTKLGVVVGQWSFGTLIFHSSSYNENKI